MGFLADLQNIEKKRVSLEPQTSLSRVLHKLRLNQKRRAKKRIPTRIQQPLYVPEQPNQVWPADFMSDALCRQDVALTHKIPASLAQMMVSQVQKFGGQSAAFLQARRNRLSKKLGGS